MMWWAGKPDKSAPSDSGTSDADSHDDSIAVEGDKLIIRQQLMPVAADTAAESSASDRVRYYHIIP